MNGVGNQVRKGLSLLSQFTQMSVETVTTIGKEIVSSLSGEEPASVVVCLWKTGEKQKGHSFFFGL